MSTTTRRRQSPAVYRRRRLVLLIAILAIAGVVWLLIAQPWRGAATVGDDGAAPAQSQDAATDLPVPVSTTPAEGGETSIEPEASASASAEASPAAPACVARDLTVEALSDQGVYGAGQNPQLSIKLTNNSDVDCTLNVGTSSQKFTITSGSDTWWRSTDCQSEPSDMVVLLAAGQTVQSASPLVWDRTRSDPATCADASRPVAPGGGASYHLSVEIGGVASTASAQLLLY